MDNFVKYFRLQNYWTQQAGETMMSAKKAMLAHPELDYNPCSTAITTARSGTNWRQTRRSSDRPLQKLAEHYGIMFFYRGQDPIDGQLAQVINGFRDTYGLSVIPVSVDGVINPLLPDSRTHQAGAAPRAEDFPAMMLVDPKQGSVRPLSYGFISQDDLAKQFLNVSEDFKPNF
ncbi:conjugal transfer protein TraF [Escherichia coli]|uniref:conjugal transfer protein TraF n=1 Tax=Escherichia coli TaxID=562 RepID=UPI003B439B13